MIVLVIHILVTITLVTLILLQNSKGGLAAGGGEFYRSRRGAEKIVFTGTIVMTLIFFVTSILSLVVR